MSSARGSGSSNGATTTAHDNSNPSVRDAAQPSDSGSGSGMGSGSGSCSLYKRVVQFSQPTSVNVPETSGPCTPSSVTLGVYVVNPSPYCPAISVNYATQNGSATAGTDYTAESGTLGFAPGQSSPDYITIPIRDDGTDESVGSEYFTVYLSNPVNAILGSPISATVNVEEGPQQKATDTLQWNPCMGNNASTVTNWYDVKQGFQLEKGAIGPNPSSPIQFDGNPLDKPNSNADINWDNGFDVASISLTDYTGQQTIYYTVESNGASGTSLSMNEAGSILKLNLINPNSQFQVDNNATISNFMFEGPHNADNDFESFIIKGGTTTIGQQNYVEDLGVNLVVQKGATFADKNQGPLSLMTDDQTITVFGEMDTYAGPKNQNTMIFGGVGNPDDFIDVSGGTLVYYGMANTKDTITVPIRVRAGGTFKLTVAQGSFAGWLIVQGGNTNTNDNSVYLTDSTSAVTLDQADTLEADNGYYQNSGTLETISGGTLQPAANPGAGTATIAGGSVVISQASGYGQLQVQAATLNFNGALELAIDATNQNNRGQLSLPNGTINLQANSTLTVYVNNGQPAAGLQWIIINAANPINPVNFVMPLITVPGTNLSDGVNPMNNKQYAVAS